jgi:hypothetical protein
MCKEALRTFSAVVYRIIMLSKLYHLIYPPFVRQANQGSMNRWLKFVFALGSRFNSCCFAGLLIATQSEII